MENWADMAGLKREARRRRVKRGIREFSVFGFQFSVTDTLGSKGTLSYPKYQVQLKTEN
jgi:hypothetical protein